MKKQKKIVKFEIKTTSVLGSHKLYSRCGNYQILKTLGTGSHAKVKLAVNNEGKQVAIKVFNNRFPQKTTIKALVNEIMILKQLDHSNILNIYEFNESMTYEVSKIIKKYNKKKNQEQVNKACIVLELASGGELFDYVDITKSFSEGSCRYYSKQLMEALSYLHNKNIVHRDLKLENLLLNSNFNLKVADFGYSAQISPDEKCNTVLGTQGYMAPEIINGQNYDGKKADVFAAAVIIFIMFTGRPPFTLATTTDFYYSLIAQNRISLFWRTHSCIQKNPNFFPSDFIDLISGMFSFEPNSRLSVEQILQHPWMTKEPIKSHESIKEEFEQRKQIVDVTLEQKRLKKINNKDHVFTEIGKF